MAIIGISGKIGTGKDTVGNIIQYLSYCNQFSTISYSTWELLEHKYSSQNWKIVKFADALKDIVCILTGCTREQLEDIDFKNSKLPDEWIRYGYADGFFKYYKNGKEETKMNNVQCSKERYELEYKTNWETAYKVHPTYRELLQYIGTDLLRNQLHENVWVNALMSKYKPKVCSGVTHCALAGKPEISCNECPEYPNWIITDCRFTNEAKAIKDKGGIIIRVNRPLYSYCGNIYNWNELYNVIFKDKGEYPLKAYADTHWLIINNHPSETALDNYNFDYIIDNNGTIEELIKKVKEILIKENIL